MNIHLDTSKLPVLKHTSLSKHLEKAQLTVNGEKIKLSNSTEEPKKSLIEALNPTESEKENASYEKLLQKVKAGDDLNPQELATIREKDPILYQKLMLEIRMQEQLEQNLKNAKTKKEAQEAYTMQTTAAAKVCGMKGDSNIKSDGERYTRLMNRLNKSWQKYLKGELKHEKPVNAKELEAKASLYNNLSSKEKENLAAAQCSSYNENLQETNSINAHGPKYDSLA